MLAVFTGLAAHGCVARQQRQVEHVTETLFILCSLLFKRLWGNVETSFLNLFASSIDETSLFAPLGQAAVEYANASQVSRRHSGLHEGLEI